MKRRITALLAGLMVAALTACSTPTSTQPADGNQGSASQPASQEQTTDKSSGAPTVITYMVTGDVPTNKTMTDGLTAVNAYLREKLNVELNVKWISWTDYMSKYNLELASQDGSIDLVGTATDWLDAWPNIQRGAFLPLTEDMLKQYAPQTWAQVPPGDWDLCKYDGKIYLMPEDNYAQWTNHGFMYRGDWAKEAGLVNGVHSWTDMGQYLQYIKDNKPGVIPWDAKPDASIVTAVNGGWLTSHTKSMYIEGLRVDLFFGESAANPYKLSRYFLEGDELVNFAKNQKAWADAGYWKEDVLNNTGIDTRKEFEQGLTGADQHHTQTFITETKLMERDYQPGSDVGFFWFGEEQNNVVALNITHGAMAVAAKSKNPGLALQVYDLIRNDKELYRLFNYGIEGQQYIVNDDGITFTRPDGFELDKDEVNFNYWWGRNDDLGLLSPDVDIAKRDALYAVYDKVKVPYQYGKVVFNLQPISSELDNLSNIYNTYMPQIVFGKAADPEAYVAEFRQQITAAGYEKCMAEVEAQLAAAYK